MKTTPHTHKHIYPLRVFFFCFCFSYLSPSSFILHFPWTCFQYFLLSGFPPVSRARFSPSQRRALYSSVGMVISLLSAAPSSRCTSSAPHWTRLSFSSSDVRSLRSSSHRHHGLCVNHGERESGLTHRHLHWVYVFVCRSGFRAPYRHYSIFINIVVVKQRGERVTTCASELVLSVLDLEGWLSNTVHHTVTDNPLKRTVGDFAASHFRFCVTRCADRNKQTATIWKLIAESASAKSTCLCVCVVCSITSQTGCLCCAIPSN